MTATTDRTITDYDETAEVAKYRYHYTRVVETTGRVVRVRIERGFRPHHQFGHEGLRRRVRVRAPSRRETAARAVTTATSTADFYDDFYGDFHGGRGCHTLWLGSLHGDADPATVRTVACGRLLLDATDPLTRSASALVLSKGLSSAGLQPVRPDLALTHRFA